VVSCCRVEAEQLISFLLKRSRFCISITNRLNLGKGRV
jgi:hypothetical protein